MPDTLIETAETYDALLDEKLRLDEHIGQAGKEMARARGELEEKMVEVRHLENDVWRLELDYWRANRQLAEVLKKMATLPRGKS